MTNKQFNAKMIQSAEVRLKSWKQLLAAPYMNKDIEYPDWYLDFMRQMKNLEESRMKLIVIEQQNL
jgi:hypothetical protein